MVSAYPVSTVGPPQRRHGITGEMYLLTMNCILSWWGHTSTNGSSYFTFMVSILPVVHDEAPLTLSPIDSVGTHTLLVWIP